jgi:alanine racemase
LIGEDGDERITADELAGWAGTIPYEVVTRLNPHIPRIVLS